MKYLITALLMIISLYVGFEIGVSYEAKRKENAPISPTLTTLSDAIITGVSRSLERDILYYQLTETDNPQQALALIREGSMDSIKKEYEYLADNLHKFGNIKQREAVELLKNLKPLYEKAHGSALGDPS